MQRLTQFQLLYILIYFAQEYEIETSKFVKMEKRILLEVSKISTA